MTGTEIEHPRGVGGEQRLAARDHPGIAGDEGAQLAGRGDVGTAEHRGGDEVAPVRRVQRRDLARTARRHGRRTDVDGPRRETGEQAVRSGEGIQHGAVVHQRRDHRLDSGRRLARRAGERGARPHQRRGLVGRPVVDDEREAGALDVVRDARAHASEADAGDSLDRVRHRTSLSRVRTRRNGRRGRRVFLSAAERP